MKKPKLWYVEYEMETLKKPRRLWFRTEAQARRVYKAATRKPGLISSSIRHVIEDNVTLIVALVTAQVSELPRFWKLWKKISSKEHAKILEAQKGIVRRILEDMGWPRS